MANIDIIWYGMYDIWVNQGVLVSNTNQSVLDGFRLFYEELAFFPRPLRKVRRSRPAKD